jgi:hypothetical protein
MLAAVALSDHLRRIAAAATAHAAAGEHLAAVLIAEARPGARVYLCAFEALDGTHTWLALDDDGAAVTERALVRDAASIAALCEIAEEGAGLEASDVRVASPEYLDSVGVRSANGNFAAALQAALPAVDDLAKDVETNYKLDLS